MIFVTVGTNEARFDRLLRAAAELSIDEQMIVQHGHSSAIAGPGAELVDFLPFDAMVETIRRSRIVVTHAGVGSILVALENAKRPIVVPRRKVHGEAVDDHQLQLGRRFAEAGLLTLVETTDALGIVVRGDHESAGAVPKASSLARDLRQYIESIVSPRSASALA
jgi:UDP-N-acetylglucosamine transferase subunit ALG13